MPRAVGKAWLYTVLVAVPVGFPFLNAAYSYEQSNRVPAMLFGGLIATAIGVIFVGLSCCVTCNNKPWLPPWATFNFVYMTAVIVACMCVFSSGVQGMGYYTKMGKLRDATVADAREHAAEFQAFYFREGDYVQETYYVREVEIVVASDDDSGAPPTPQYNFYHVIAIVPNYASWREIEPRPKFFAVWVVTRNKGYNAMSVNEAFDNMEFRRVATLTDGSRDDPVDEYLAAVREAAAVKSLDLPVLDKDVVLLRNKDPQDRLDYYSGLAHDSALAYLICMLVYLLFLLGPAAYELLISGCSCTQCLDAHYDPNATCEVKFGKRDEACCCFRGSSSGSSGGGSSSRATDVAARAKTIELV